MSDFVRIQDNDTGDKASVSSGLAALLVSRGAATVLDEPAVDAVFGAPLPSEPAPPPTAKATKTSSTTTGKQGDL